MADVFSFPEKKQAAKGPVFYELQVERQHLSRQLLDIIRAKNEALSRFNDDTNRLSLEMVGVVGRQSEIDELLAQFVGVPK